ncbi:R3H domain-containing nucleic acid-binding protein [Treponema endosymbiont of Eucomonympha sp.]|uniref:R3H domain-containing nucleic acid-binding protein n=1 Tax=Treponema endosymbiont of Eucomonympha sp. TaxID=1580831 RepID=UPI00075079F5|nr:R3H domain-containing nucleic acid-binding protein [Treponema endosymbiont of Eucomonympha sp.]
MVYEYEAKTEREAIEMAVKKLGLERESFDVEIIETQKNTLFKKGYVKIRVHTLNTVKFQREENDNAENRRKHLILKRRVAEPLSKDDFEKKLLEFISLVVQKISCKCTVDIMFRGGGELGIRLISPYSSILIGHKGKNLDALQLLTNAYAENLGQRDVRIILDAENYRIRCEESLVRLAYTTADAVRISHSSVLLGPMNPPERKLIHATLNDVDDIETKSEGNELYRQVRVIFKA